MRTKSQRQIVHNEVLKTLTGTQDVESSQSCSKFPRILVSIREIQELESILSIGVDVIDLKEPRQGALAATDPSMWDEIARRWIRSGASPGSRWSVALGEMDHAVRIAKHCPPEFDYAKAGPFGCCTRQILKQGWQSLRDQLPNSVELVAVAYADRQSTAETNERTFLSAAEIVHAAIEMKFKTVLIDTHSKNSGNLIEHLGSPMLAEILELARRGGLECFLAGGLTLEHAMMLSQSLNPAPTGFGFRGAFCSGNRADRLDPDLVRAAIAKRHCQDKLGGNQLLPAE